MKNAEADFFIFIAAIVVGVLISLNIDFVKIEKKDNMTLNEYQDAYENRAKLYSDINTLSKEKKNLEKKIEKHRQARIKEDESVAQKIEEELEVNNNILGKNDVKGQGLSIKLEDGEEAFEGEIMDSFIRRQRTIHDNDMNDLLNDIKAAGAQAIAINNNRIIHNSSVYCAGQFLVIDGIKTPAPFKIDLIGDVEMIKSRLLGEESTLKKMIVRGIKVDIEEKEEIKIKRCKSKIENIYTHKVNNN